jgi:hypothetical protein
MPGEGEQLESMLADFFLWLLLMPVSPEVNYAAAADEIPALSRPQKNSLFFAKQLSRPGIGANTALNIAVLTPIPRARESVEHLSYEQSNLSHGGSHSRSIN